MTTYTLRDSGCTQYAPVRRVIRAIRDWYAVDYGWGDGIRPSKASILRAWRDARQAEKAENADGPVDLERLAYWYSDKVSRLVTTGEQGRNEWLAYMALHVVADERE